MDKNKNEKLSEILEKYKNLPITDDISIIAQTLYNKTADKMKSLAEKYKNSDVKRHIDENRIKYGPNSRIKHPHECMNKSDDNASQTGEKIVFSEPTTSFDAENHLTSDDIIHYVPAEMLIDGDDCVFNLTMITVEGQQQYVVTYDRRSDGWTCKTFYGDTLRDVLNEVATFASEK